MAIYFDTQTADLPHPIRQDLEGVASERRDFRVWMSSGGVSWDRVHTQEVSGEFLCRLPWVISKMSKPSQVSNKAPAAALVRLGDPRTIGMVEITKYPKVDTTTRL